MENAVFDPISGDATPTEQISEDLLAGFIDNYDLNGQGFFTNYLSGSILLKTLISLKLCR